MIVVKESLIKFILRKITGCFFICLFLASLNISAIEMTQLYEVEVDYEANTFRSSRYAQKQALEKFLIRIADPDIYNLPNLIDRFFPDPIRYIKQFEPGKNGGLIVSMNGDAIQEVLLEGGQSVWGIDRPIVMVLVAVDMGMGERGIINSGFGDGLYSKSGKINRVQLIKEKMEKVAHERGIYIAFPEMNLKEKDVLNFSDVWAGFIDNMFNLAASYDSSMILNGKIRDDEINISEWQFYSDKSVIDFIATPEEAINQLADMLAKRYMYSGKVPPKEVDMFFSGIESIDNFGEVYLALDGLSMIEDYSVRRIGKDFVEFLVSYNGFFDDLVTSLNTNKMFSVDQELDDSLGFTKRKNKILKYKFKIK